MRILLTMFFGALAIACLAAVFHAAVRTSFQRVVPFRRLTLAVFAVWLGLAAVIMEREWSQPPDRMGRLRLAGAGLSLLAAGCFFLDYRRYRLTQGALAAAGRSVDGPGGRVWGDDGRGDR